MAHRITLSGEQSKCIEVLNYSSNLDLTLIDFSPEPPDYSGFKVFVSYRRADSSDIAGRIYDHLAWEFGAYSAFLDIESIPAGNAWEPILIEHASTCTMMLAIIGTDWLTSVDENGEQRLFQDSDFVRLELSIALSRQNVPVVPVLIQGATLPKPEQLPENIQSLAGRQTVELRSGVHFRKDIEGLIQKVKNQFDLLNSS